MQVQLSAQALELWDQPALSSVFSVAFNISDADRVPGKQNVAVTFGFKPQTVMNSGGSITLNYPSAFFAPEVTPSSASSSVQGLGFTLLPTTLVSVVLVLDNTLVAANSIVITLNGMNMGPATPGSAVGVTVQTSADVAISRAVPSGAIEGRVTSVVFNIFTAHRIAGNGNATITLAFIPSSPINDLQLATMNYPHEFFLPGVIAIFVASNTNFGPDNFAVQPTSNTSLIFQLNAASLQASSPFIATISGLALGAATDGSPTGITVQTSTDTGLSVPVDSGPIFMSLVPIAVSAFPRSPFAGESVTVSGHSFILPDFRFNCSAKIGPVPSFGVPATCVLLSSSRALVHLPHDVVIAPSYVQLHFEPGNVSTTAATRLCPCARASGGTVCGCSAETCATRL